MTDNSNPNGPYSNPGAVPPPPPAAYGGFQPGAPAPTPPRSGYQAPQAPLNNPGTPAWAQSAPAQAGKTFLKALLDFSFTTFITRRLATVIYGISVAVIAITAVVMLLGGLISGLTALNYSSGGGLMLIFGSLIGVPIGALLATIVVRLSIEAGVALVAVAENTSRIGESTTSE